MSGDEVKEWVIQHLDLLEKAKQEWNQIFRDLYSIRNQELDIEEKIPLIDEKADQLASISVGRDSAEAAIREKLETLWEKMDERSREFLITAQVIESTIADVDGDYAPVVIEMGRVFENEIQKKVFIKYINTLSQKEPAISDTSVFYKDIVDAVNNYKASHKYFISATRMMKYIGDLSYKDNNSRPFRKELRNLLDKKNANIRDLSKKDKVDEVCNYIDEYRNKAAHPNTADNPNIISKNKVESCKNETRNVLDYFITNVGQ